MTFEQVDWLVGQWAAWIVKGDSTLKSLGEAKSKWQDEYITPLYGDKKPVRLLVVDISDDVASIIDRIMAKMLHEIPNTQYREWARRAFGSQNRSLSDGEVLALDQAKDRFEFYFEKILPKNEKMLLTSFRGRGAPREKQSC